MTTTNVTIVNHALVKIGGYSPIAAMDDDSDQAKAANQIFTDVIEDLMAERNWNFAMGRDEGIRTRKTITGITAADPPVVTAVAHGFSDGDTVLIEDVVGMTQVNGVKFKVANKAADTFELTDHQDEDIDGSSYTAYSSGGKAMLSPIFEYKYQFDLPTDCLRVVTEYNDYEFRIEGGKLITDASEPQIVYIKNITDYTLLPPKFRTALIDRLAHDLCLELKGSGKQTDSLYKKMNRSLKKARQTDAREGTPFTLPDGSWLDARTE